MTTKKIFEEAIVDVKKLRELAEANARDAVFEATVPIIREFIDRTLAEEAGGWQDAEPLGEPVDLPDDDDVTPPPQDELKPVDAVPSTLSGGGAVVVDVDSVVADDEASLPDDVVDVLSKDVTTIDDELDVLKRECRSFSGVSDKLRKTFAFQNALSTLISRVENTYERAQSIIRSPEKLGSINETLEKLNSDLEDLVETKEMKDKKKRLNEEDVTLKLTGLPDDLELDDIGIDLISDEGEEVDVTPEGGDEDLDVGGDEGGEGGDDLDLDFGGDEGGDEEEVAQESIDFSKLSDDTVIEIDESVLRSELRRLRRSRRLAENAPDKKVLDDFGDADVCGHPDELDVTTADNEKGDMKVENRRRAAMRRARAAALAERRARKGGDRSDRTQSTVLESQGLRAKLDEANLYNAKLMYANKLLQNESLSKRQKAQAISRLDTTKTIREAKLVYDTVIKAVTRRENVNESVDRSVVGSSSAPSRSSSPSLVQEGFEVERWGKLAGLIR